MLVSRHIHYSLLADGGVWKEAFDFSPAIEVESLVTTKGLWFPPKQSDGRHRLFFSDAHPAHKRALRAPRVLRDTRLHIDDVASSISVVLPLKRRLNNIDPGVIHRAEVDITYMHNRGMDRSLHFLLAYLFTNPQPLSPLPFNIDADLVDDKHDYLRRLMDNGDRAYHKLLVRKCLAPGYQVWPEVMDFETASVYCDRVKSTIATWVREGRVKASPDTKPLILKKNLDAYLESR